MKATSIRLDEDVKQEAAVVLASMGLTVSDACRLLITRIAENKAFPMELLTPSLARIEAARKRAAA